MSLKYRISNIGWYNFELLVQTLLKALIGPGVTSFGGSKDRGRDAAFVGPAAFPSSECQWTGNWVFQVKYLDFEEQGADAARSSLKSTLRSELPYVTRRHPNTNNYILLTDVPLTAQSRSELSELVTGCGFSGNFAAVDGKEICQFLDKHPEIRRSYPQLLGLADLDVIVNRDLYSRSQAYLESWQPRLATYVQTAAHQNAISLLKKEHFIVLDGPPEAGKTTIAAAIALIYAAEGYEIIDVRSSNDVFRASDSPSAFRKKSEQKRRLFVADDAIGSISLVAARADEWSRDLPGILRQLSTRRLLVWTARRYILEEALATSRLKEATTEFPRPHEVLVEVGELSVMQKAEILYNHAKQANLSAAHREMIRSHAAEIIIHRNFSPLRIRELTSIVLKSSTDGQDRCVVTWEKVSKFLGNPGERWIQAFRALSQSEQTLLCTMLDFEGSTPARALRANYETRVSSRGGGHLSFDECVARLDQLSDSDSNQLLTARISVGGDEPPDRKAQESAQKSRLVPITSSLSGSEARVLAKGAILSGDFNRAVQSSSIALAKDPSDPRSHLDYAIALYKSHAEPTLVYEALKKAHDLITPDLDASVQADIYNSLIYVALYQAPPEGLTKAIEYSEEALRKNLPVGAAFWINTACAYGQQYEYQKTSGADTELLLKARSSAVAAVKKALSLDPQLEARLRQLSLAKNDDGTENWDDDLQVLAKDDEELRSLLHL